MRMKCCRAALVVGVVASAAWPSTGQIVLVPVPGDDRQPDGPVYTFHVGAFEVTNAQYVAFLNDAEFHNETQNPGFGNERGDNLRWRTPLEPGDVGLLVGGSSVVDGVFDRSRSLILYDPAAIVGARYAPVAGKEEHPAVGMSWIGAAKYCNWLTISESIGLDQRCYAEGSAETDWFPITIGSDVGGTQSATNIARALNPLERAALVRDYRGYRLLMDQGGTAVGPTNAVPRRFNEWFKAAAWHPDAPDTPRTFFVGSFEEHTVPPNHWLHAFGRDPLVDMDANYRDSGDPFDSPIAAVIATTPVGYYDGSLQDGSFATNPNDNRFGIFDMSGNVWEFLTDRVEISVRPAPDRAIAGGSYRSNIRQVSAANRGDISPASTRPVVGLRVARVLLPPCETGDWTLDGNVTIADLTGMASCLTGVTVLWTDRACPCVDLDDDKDVDLHDYAALQRAANGPAPAR